MPLDPIASLTTRSYPLRIYLKDGVTPSTAFVLTDVLAGELWTGDDRTPAASPAAAWDLDPPDYRLTITPADTAGLVPGTYRVRVTATRGADTVEILRESVELLAVAGTAAPIPVYCTYEDMALHCSWIGQYLDTGEDQTGFAEQRGEARAWLDGLILRAQPRGGGLNLISTQNYWTWNSGGGGYDGSGLAVDQVMRGYLDAGGLVLTGGNGRQAVRACACYAIALVFGAMPDPSMQKFAGLFMRKAHSEASTLVVEIDSDADGVSEYAIALSSTNTRYA